MGLIPRKTLTLSRPAAGSYVNGVWVEGAVTQSFFEASVQPLAGKEIELLPEERRNTESYKLFTDTELLTVNTSSRRNADIITIDGRNFEVYSVKSWQNTIINHYEVVVFAK